MVAIGTVAAFTACGDEAKPPPDGGAPPRLVVEDPPGDTIGVTPGESRTLRVHLTTAAGEPIAGAPVRWTILASDRGTGGATLRVATSATGGDGWTDNVVTAGLTRVDFRIAAESGDAPEAFFYVTVSSAGFTNVRVTPGHVGVRGDAGGIELRIFHDDLGCDGIDPDDPPISKLAPRAVTGFGVAAEWPALAAGEAYRVIGWSVHASGRAIGFGCAPLAASQVTPGDLAMTLAIVDRPIRVAATTVTTSLDLAPAVAAETAAGIDRPWRVLACPAGAGQLLLDWIVDALAGDGALDGVTTAPTGPALAIENARGPLGADGCRATIDAGAPSLDEALDEAIARGAFPDRPARQALVASRLALLGSLPLVSSLVPSGPGQVRHALTSARVGGITVDLAASARPVIAADAAWTYDPSVQVLRLASHGFTARLGAALGAGFAIGPLAGDGLGGQAATLGDAMLGSATSGTLVGCAAVENIVCGAAGLGPSCASAACTPAATGLDAALTAWWRALDGTDLDLALTGTAKTGDASGDLTFDDIAGGLWSATITTPTLGATATTGTFTTTALPN